MFCGENIHWIVQSFLYSAFTLFVECLPSKEIVQKLSGDDKQMYLYITGRPDAPERIIAAVPTRKTYYSRLLTDQDIFFIVLGIGLILIFVLVVIYLQGKSNTRQAATASGTTVRSPPRQQQREFGAYQNAGFLNVVHFTAHSGIGVHEVDNVMDPPPDYSTVTLSDLDRQSGTYFPAVTKKNIETPPPQYEENRPFS